MNIEPYPLDPDFDANMAIIELIDYPGYTDIIENLI